MNSKTLLLRMPNWLGDIVMATSALESLHRTGRYEIHLLIRPPWHDLFRHDSRVAEVIECRDGGMGLFSTVADIRRRKFETVVDFTHSFRSALIWKLSSIPKIYRENSDDAQAPNRHQAMRYLSVIRHLAGSGLPVPCPPALTAPPISSPPYKGGGGGGSGFSDPDEILIFPAAAYGPAKMWSAERYSDLIRLLLARGWSMRLVGTESDRPFLDRIVSLSTSLPRSIAPSIPDLMRLIASSRAVISCDSGPAHLASALGRPVVVLFFSTDPVRTSPLGFAVRPIVASVPCRPCFLRRCPIGFLCRDTITPADILRHLDDLFDVPTAQP